ncbi:hypothetical protein C8R44DRAFT_884939 [Mycena epipterygia]|nr:hypothetical protein C8R44DRAFT_884939 [Mycena epipterygia]
MSFASRTLAESVSREQLEQIQRYCRRLAATQPQAAFDALLSLRPYWDGPGYIYVFVIWDQDAEAILAATPPGDATDVFTIKVGRAEDVEDRRARHEEQCPSLERMWAFKYPTNHAKLLERLVHLTLQFFGARHPFRECPDCAVRHMEYFSELLSGGLEGVAAVIEYWLSRIGEIPISSDINLRDPTKFIQISVKKEQRSAAWDGREAGSCVTPAVGRMNENAAATVTLAYHEGATCRLGFYGCIMPSLGGIYGWLAARNDKWSIYIY